MKHSKPTTPRTYKRVSARVTKDEKEVIKAIVRQAGGDLPLEDTKAVAKMFNRPVGTVKRMIASARLNLAADAEFYVDTHRAVVQHAASVALATNDDKVMEVARKGAEWAMAAISGEGSRIVDKVEAGPAGTRIFIGVKLSNMPAQPNAVIDISPDAMEVVDGPSGS